MESKEDFIKITAEQQKILANSTRIKLLHLLRKKALTAKQAADRLKKTAGSVHYHIRKLHEAGLLELVETRANGGVLEKYYRAKTTRFVADPDVELPKGKRAGYIGTRLALTKDQKEQFITEITQLFERWESIMETTHEDAEEISVDCILTKVEKEEE